MGELNKSWWLGRWRLLFGYCPACNSGAPLMRDCPICNGYSQASGHTFPPAKGLRRFWLLKFWMWRRGQGIPVEKPGDYYDAKLDHYVIAAWNRRAEQKGRDK